MKKSFFIKSIIILTVFCALILTLFACEEKPLSSATYTSNVVENGVNVTYVLIIDENNGTFLLSKQLDTEIRYSGTYILQNGYYTLTSESNGTEYVKVVGDEFFYITMSDTKEDTVCQHDYVFSREVSGNCKQLGYNEYVCSICSDIKKENTTYGSHNYKNTSYTKGTCLVKGKTVKTCNICSNTITVYDENYGEHTYTDVFTDDQGCNTLLVERTRCTLCDKIVETEISTLGSHKYDENGVCSICNYDETGICHDHVDTDDNNVCDGCTLPYSGISDFNENGYYIDDQGYLYLGAYPSKEVSYVSDVIKYGKIDNSTGYYRYNGASYLLVEKNSVQRAYLVTTIEWTPVTINSITYYVSNQIIEKLQFLNDTNCSKITEKVDNNYVTNYYNNKVTTEKIFANDFLNSDIYQYANYDFKEKAFLSTTKKNNLDGDIIIPNLDFIELFTTSGNYKCEYTDYAKYTSNDSISYCPIFTSSTTKQEVTLVSNEVLVFYNSLNGQSSANVTSSCGFLPIIRFSEN